ncbi:MAG: hypothetical protein QXJ17_07035 [Nitrososphaeria archaeon]
MSRSRYIAFVSIISALGGVLQAYLAPLTFAILRLPFGHDILVFFPLLLSGWVIRKVGSVSGVGIVSSLVFLFLRPGMFLVTAFAFSSILLDLLLYAIKYEITFKIKNIILVSAMVALSAYIAGAIIGFFFMTGSLDYALFIWGPLHVVGGILALLITYSILAALERTGVRKKIAL